MSEEQIKLEVVEEILAEEEAAEKAAEGTDAIAVSRRNGHSRIEAGLAYMSDPKCGSIEKLSQDPRFMHVNKRTLERWASEDKWVARRQKFLDTWSRRAARKLGSELCKVRQAELNHLLEIQMLGMEKVRDELTLPKSWEGVVKVLIDANRRIEEVSTNIGNELMPPGSEAGALTAGQTSMTDEERSAARKAILASRRQGMRVVNAEECQDTASDPDPT
jgi:hypothetical protein